MPPVVVVCAGTPQVVAGPGAGLGCGWVWIRVGVQATQARWVCPGWSHRSLRAGTGRRRPGVMWASRARVPRVGVVLGTSAAPARPQEPWQVAARLSGVGVHAFAVGRQPPGKRGQRFHQGPRQWHDRVSTWGPVQGKGTCVGTDSGGDPGVFSMVLVGPRTTAGKEAAAGRACTDPRPGDRGLTAAGWSYSQRADWPTLSYRDQQGLRGASSATHRTVLPVTQVAFHASAPIPARDPERAR